MTPQEVIVLLRWLVMLSEEKIHSELTQLFLYLVSMQYSNVTIMTQRTGIKGGITVSADNVMQLKPTIAAVTAKAPVYIQEQQPHFLREWVS